MVQMNLLLSVVQMNLLQMVQMNLLLSSYNFSDPLYLPWAQLIRLQPCLRPKYHKNLIFNQNAMDY